MSEYRGLTGKTYRTQSTPFAGGGEGDVYDIIGMPQFVAKIYKPDKRTTERERKLSVMVAHQPSVLDQYAWPMDVLYENGRFMGFIMPRISGKEKLRNLYVYDKRGGKPWSLYIAIAKNLAAAVHNVHEIHQVVGDLNPENILVSPSSGMVTLVDTDSYHISDASRTYRCMVGMPEFVAPELQGIHFPSAPLPTFTYSSDRFALAVLIFALLMNGAHPFSCKVISGSSSKFQPIDNMQNGKCAYFPDSRTSNIDIPRYSPDINSLPENIQQLFRRAFVAGLKNPSQRPSAEEWYRALDQLENNLKTCLQNNSHIYYYGAKECPWCKVNTKMRSISQSAFNSSSQSGSSTGSTVPPVRGGGQTSTFTPSNYSYNPSQSSSSATQPVRKKKKKWVIFLVLGIIASTLIDVFYLSHTCHNNILGCNKNQSSYSSGSSSTNDGYNSDESTYNTDQSYQAEIDDNSSYNYDDPSGDGWIQDSTEYYFIDEYYEARGYTEGQYLKRYSDDDNKRNDSVGLKYMWKTCYFGKNGQTYTGPIVIGGYERNNAIATVIIGSSTKTYDQTINQYYDSGYLELQNPDGKYFWLDFGLGALSEPAKWYGPPEEYGYYRIRVKVDGEDSIETPWLDCYDIDWYSINISGANTIRIYIDASVGSTGGSPNPGLFDIVFSTAG